MPSLADHLFVLLFAVVYPIIAAIRYPREKREMQANTPGRRQRTYRRALISQWALFFVAIGIWIFRERWPGRLGFSPFVYWMPTAVGVLLAAGLLGLLSFAQRKALRSAELHRMVREQIERDIPFLPTNSLELRAFLPLAVTAGVCEETLWRGYLIWYLTGAAVLLGLAQDEGDAPALALAVAVSSLGFGAAHLYAGPRYAIQAGVVGLLAAGLYVYTGALWAPILLHAAIDVNAGYFARRVFTRPPAGPAEGDDQPDGGER